MEDDTAPFHIHETATIARHRKRDRFDFALRLLFAALLAGATWGFLSSTAAVRHAQAHRQIPK